MKKLALLAVPLALLVAACSSDDGGGATAATSATTTTVASTTTAAGSATTTTAATVTKVNANTATVAQITAALDAAGVSNASRWAREVEEYRPYPTDDPTFAKLRKELAKYNPAAGVVDQIISALAL
jgi:ABC-type enterochelin transport system substrate-binding protein